MKQLSIEITSSSYSFFTNNTAFCVGTGRMGLALQEEYQIGSVSYAVTGVASATVNIEQTAAESNGQTETVEGAEADGEAAATDHAAADPAADGDYLTHFSPSSFSALPLAIL